MPTQPIIAVTGIKPSAGNVKPSDAGNAGSTLENFGQVLNETLDSLNQVDNDANNAIARLAAGEDVELHQVMLAVQQADIAFNLALQVRNKLVEAYQEVMRMQV
jgi:flagellar hook-basal body complex protein FliE